MPATIWPAFLHEMESSLQPPSAPMEMQALRQARARLRWFTVVLLPCSAGRAAFVTQSNDLTALTTNLALHQASGTVGWAIPSPSIIGHPDFVATYIPWLGRRVAAGRVAGPRGARAGERTLVLTSRKRARARAIASK